MGDDDVGVAASEDSAGPFAQPSHLSRDVRGDVLAEAHGLLLGSRNDQEMEVVAEHDDGADVDLVALLGHRQDADDEAVDEPVGLEQKPSLKGLEW